MADNVMTRDDSPGGVVVPGDAARYKAQREDYKNVPMGPVTDAAAETDAAAPIAAMEDIGTEREEVEVTGAGDEGVEGEKESKEEDDEGEDGMDDLFGDDAGNASDEEGAPREASAPATPPADEENDEGLTPAELERRKRLEYEEEDADQQTLLEKQAPQSYEDVKIAKLPMARGDENTKLYHARLPNFLHLESKPFSPSTWNREDEPHTVPIDNTMRWRWRPSPSSSTQESSASPPKKQSNARIIRWNDGSLSLQVGAEIFDVQTEKSNMGTPGVKLAAPQTYTYLVAQHGYTQLLESQALIDGNMSFRPTTIQSNAHRKIASGLKKQGSSGSIPGTPSGAGGPVPSSGAIAAAINAKKGVVMMSTDSAASAEAERIKQERLLSGPGRKGGKRGARGEGGAGGAAGKKSSSKRKSVRSTRLSDFDDDDVGPADEDMDLDDDRAENAAKAARKKQREQAREELDDFLATESEDEDASEEDDDDRGKKSSGRRAREEEEMQVDDEMDDLEAMAERAAKQKRERKKQKAAAAGSATMTDRTEVRASQQNTRQASPDSEDLDQSETEQAVVKKKLVVESDEE